MSEINMDNKGSINASPRLLTIAPAKMAIAHWGANPKGRPGSALYKDANTTINSIVKKSDLFPFIA